MYDLIIIGGGINGTGIARDASGRGVSVLLLEQGDLAGATSSASSKLIHGGLRYLEHFKFGLVREALAEREVLWRIAPHLIKPLRFVLPHQSGMRPIWMLWAGLFLYDALAPRKVLAGARTIGLCSAVEGEALKAAFHTGFVYSDCAVDDSRLTILNARDAADRGAQIRSRSRVVSMKRSPGQWRLDYLSDGKTVEVEARALVNAAGPWVDEVARLALGPRREAIRLVRGSHLIVRRRFSHDACYTLQNSDGRIVFAIPFGEQFTLIGTTDMDHHGDPALVEMTPEEQAYMLDAVNIYFADPLSSEDVVHAYSGVRALYDDGAANAKDTTREYVLALDRSAAPVISVYGGKITTYRRLAEDVMDRLAPHLPGMRRDSWTSKVPLPGGDMPMLGRAEYLVTLSTRYPELPGELLHRLMSAYGTRAAVVLGDAHSVSDLGRHFGSGLYARELDYLMDQEWAQTAEDVLWRRSKLGLSLDGTAAGAIDSYMASRAPLHRIAAE